MTAPQDSTAGFSWPLQSTINILDHGGRLPDLHNFASLFDPEHFALIIFDPTGRHHDDADLKQLSHVQLLTYASLGNGQPATLYACMGTSWSATLRPKLDYLSESQQLMAQVISELSVGTLALDSLDDLDAIDWLTLDSKSDNLSILQHGERALQNTLMFQIAIPFVPHYEGQTTFGEIDQWMTRNGYRCYHIANQKYSSLLAEPPGTARGYHSQLSSAEMIYIPTEEKLNSLTSEQLVKLAYLMDAVHELVDLPHYLLAKVDPKLAEQYLSLHDNSDPFAHEESFVLTSEYSPAPWSETPQF